MWWFLNAFLCYEFHELCWGSWMSKTGFMTENAQEQSQPKVPDEWLAEILFHNLYDHCLNHQPSVLFWKVCDELMFWYVHGLFVEMVVWLFSLIPVETCPPLSHRHEEMKAMTYCCYHHKRSQPLWLRGVTISHWMASCYMQDVDRLHQYQRLWLLLWLVEIEKCLSSEERHGRF